MIDKKDFSLMGKEYNNFDNAREAFIKKSRDLLKTSKQLIYAVHRNDIASADKLINKLNNQYSEILIMLKKTPELITVGQYRITISEYVEAALYYHFVKKRKLPTHTQLKVPTEGYLMGVSDFTGELARKAVQAAGKNKPDEALKIKDLIDEIYGQLLNFDFRNSDLRKKFDAVKYNLKKLEDLALQIKLKN